MLPFEMNRFWPFSTHSLPSRRAVVARFPASLPGPGVLLGHGCPEETESRHLAVEGLWDLAFLFPIPDVRDELSIDEIPCGVADEPLLFRQPKVHRAASRGLSCPIRINFRRLRGRVGSAISGPHRPGCAWSGSPTLGRLARRRFDCRPCTA